jgi:hypothetical protein
MPAGVVDGVGLVVGVPAGAVHWAPLPSACPSDLAGPAHPPAAVSVGVGFVVWMASRAATWQPRARTAANTDIDRQAPLVGASSSNQAPELLLGSPTPHTMLLSSGQGMGQALVLDGAAVTEGQSLLLSLGRQSAILMQLPCVGDIGGEEDVVVG